MCPVNNTLSVKLALSFSIDLLNVQVIIYYCDFSWSGRLWTVKFQLGWFFLKQARSAWPLSGVGPSWLFSLRPSLPQAPAPLHPRRVHACRRPSLLSQGLNILSAQQSLCVSKPFCHPWSHVHDWTHTHTQVETAFSTYSTPLPLFVFCLRLTAIPSSISLLFWPKDIE